MSHSFILFIAFINILISPAIAFSQPAFPGAEGFGANSMAEAEELLKLLILMTLVLVVCERQLKLKDQEL
jgi:hypothetical protein